MHSTHTLPLPRASGTDVEARSAHFRVLGAAAVACVMTFKFPADPGSAIELGRGAGLVRESPSQGSREFAQRSGRPRLLAPTLSALQLGTELR